MKRALLFALATIVVVIGLGLVSVREMRRNLEASTGVKQAGSPPSEPTVAATPPATFTPAPTAALPAIHVLPTAAMPDTAPPAAAAPELTPAVILTSTPTPTLTPAPTTTTTTTTTAPAAVETATSTASAPDVDISSFRPAALRFRPRPDGYSFRNYGGVEASDFTITDTRRMFGDFAVCLDPGAACIPRLTAVEWTEWANALAKNGRCDGFTTTGLRFYTALDRQADFKARARNTYALAKDNIRRQIAYYWILQIPDPIASLRGRSLRQTPNQVLGQLISAMSTSPPDPVTLLVYNNATRTSGHSVTPYAVENRGRGVWRVRVYDSNWPNDRNRFVVVDTNSNTWKYNLGPSIGTWSGDAGTRSLGAVPVSAYAESPECPWCQTGVQEVNVAHLLAWHDEASELLVTDSQGRKLGVDDGRLAEEIPQAFELTVPGGLGLRDTSIHYLPVTDTYTLTLSLPTSLTSSQPSEMVEFGPGYAVSVSDIHLAPDGSSQLTAGADGRQITYRSGNDDRVTLSVVAEGEAASDKFVIEGLPVGQARAVTVTVDAAGGELVLDNSQNISGTYTLSYTHSAPDGQRTFAATDVELSAGDTHSVPYGAWDGTGPMSLSVDVGSRNAVTQTRRLGGWAVYLPFVVKCDPCPACSGQGR